MTEAHITAVRKLRGESVQYWKGGEIKQGILEDISYISNSDDLHAHIKVNLYFEILNDYLNTIYTHFKYH